MTKAFDCAMRLLARREHGRWELLTKLTQKKYPQAESLDALDQCERLGLQSDQRFAESICRVRTQQGYGPIRITQELQSKRIDSTLIDHVLSAYDDQWEELVSVVWQKKFKGQRVTGEEWFKQQRFLLYRGFSREIIMSILNGVEYE